jgi:hypothetical protein
MTRWQSITTAPCGEPVIVTNGSVWTLARLVSIPVQRLGFTWPPIKSDKEWRWVFSCSRITPIDFTPTHWQRPELGPPPGSRPQSASQVADVLAATGMG